MQGHRVTVEPVKAVLTQALPIVLRIYADPVDTVMEPPDTSSQTVHQYVVPICFLMVEIGVYSSGFSVTLSLGLLIRFVTIIGHHPPDESS